MDPEKPELPDGDGLSPVLLYGEFTGAQNRRTRFAVRLTERRLSAQRIAAAPAARSQVLHNLEDCVGCRAFAEQDASDSGAYFSAYFYPLRRRWMSSGAARQRVERCFRVASSQDAQLNLAEAERWARAIRQGCSRPRPHRAGTLYDMLPTPGRLLLLLNPHSGKGQGLSLFNSHIQGMLTEAGVPHTLVVTERQNHARELVREADLSQWDAVVIMSGDGLLFEVVNGLMEREDWETAIQTPLGILPGGSGNALAASINHYSGSHAVTGEELLVNCGFLLCKGLVSRLDLASVHMASSQRLFSFLSLAWGFVADVDTESEKYRHVGAARFTLGTLVRLTSLRLYRGRLAYLPAEEPQLQPQSPAEGSPPAHGSSFCSSLLCRPGKASSDQNAAHTLYNSSNSNNATKAKSSESPPAALRGPDDSLLVPLDQPVPGHWTVVKEEEFVLMLAMYQSHLAEDLFAAPESTLSDGLIHLFYVKAGISRAALLRLFLAMEKGVHLTSNCPQLVYVRVRAFRLEPFTPKGVITVDGEVVEYGPVQAQVHNGLGRLVTG
ncbi:sphingosine kinase 1 [Amia ocellicauda]|uniref:sphingosine kinase 1 n=1 Tax=Amia ocellicauda TaxID=2972642 RepID=UPI0034649FCC